MFEYGIAINDGCVIMVLVKKRPKIMNITKEELVDLYVDATALDILFENSACFVQDTAQMEEDYKHLVEAKDRLMGRVSDLLERYNKEC